MDVDQKAELYNKGVIEGQKHSVPSPETKTFMAVIKEQLESIHDAVLRTECHAKTTNGKVAAQEKEIFNMKLKMGNKPLENQYASKLTEKIMFGLIGLILVGVVTQWVNIVVTKGNYEKFIAQEIETYLEANVETVEYND